MEIKLKFEESGDNRDFLDWAGRLTLKKDLTGQDLDDFETIMGYRFRDIVKKVESGSGGPDMPAEDVVDELYEYFKDFNYNVSKEKCLKILQYHKKHKFKQHWASGGAPNY